MNVPYYPLGKLLESDRAAFHQALDRVLDSGHILLGRELESFEAAFARVAGTAHCVGVASGLDAIALMLLASGLPEGSEVLVPANSFVASALGIERAGLKAVPVDIDPTTGNIDVAKLADSCTDRTRAVLAVHLHGIPCDMDALEAACKRLGIILFEDAAQAHGARWKGKPCGSFGAAAAFSFYPGKNLGALGDGGAATTSDPELDAQLRLWRNYGSRVKYVHQLPGWNSRLEELQAAFLSVRLAHLEADNQARSRAAARYRSLLAGVPGIRLPVVPDGAQPAWHLFPILCDDRAAVQSRLEKAGVATLVHYPVPIHRQACLPHLASRHLPSAEWWCDRTLSLPIHPLVSDAEIEHVAEALAER
jgi:dTDP-4-amino-4,6-dideoxygalactose transaminase